MIDLVRRKVRITTIFTIGLMSVLATLVFIAQAQAPSSGGPVPSEDTIERWLHGGEPRLEAWGAHYALITHNQNLIPELVSLANQWQPLVRQACDSSPCSELSSAQRDEREGMATVLDVLIQLNGHVSPDALRNLAPDFANYVAVLLARLPGGESSDLALDLYHAPPERGEVLQYVGAALVAQHPPYGFAADLLASIRVHATVVVVDPGSTASGNGTGGGSCGDGNGNAPREDWPAAGQYMLSDQKGASSSVVIQGVDPLYAVRIESTWYLGDSCQMTSRVQLDPAARLRLIAEMLEVSPETVPWQTSFEKRIEFKSVDQVDNAILALAEDQQDKYRQTANALVQHDLLIYSDVESSLPKLEIEIQDTRGPVRVPVEPLPVLPTGVSWDAATR